MVHFCTYFDRHYLHRGLALYGSLARTTETFCLWVLCFDDETETTLRALALRNIRTINVRELERYDTPLAETKARRARVEYYWTSTSPFIRYLFSTHPEIQALVYVDADVYFFSSPSALFHALGQGSILLVPHDFSDAFRGHETAGKYNVGVMVFRRDTGTMQCLNWWRERCLEWCYDRHEDGKMGDQAYLDVWPQEFKGVVVSADAGINAAPWNISKYSVTAGSQNAIAVGGHPLVCYHFHGLKFCSRRLVFVMSSEVELRKIVKHLIYRPYLGALCWWDEQLRALGHEMPLPVAGMPWRYIMSRIRRREPLRHFMWIS